ncbi:hypothetical protein SG34_033710 [Thalassomonas viridans]|uniref:Uncharacterized protein n=1 Tax=Thalassomonas viridans TaxID=137584 RepID=A0AAF0CDI5_9GAMM|nr:hypothetical protein [Thalassomonas viridans]WDE08851.1 hypothetical protein SG34_033710 [Thalassomonas viridans]
MSESNVGPNNGQTSSKALLSMLISLTDNFHKFNEECAFLCDAFAAVAREPDDISEDTSEGIGHISARLKAQLKAYDERIYTLYKTVQSQQQQSAENEEEE